MSVVREIIEEYRLQKVLKTSVHSTVFRASDPQSGDEVVIKLLNPPGERAPQENCTAFLEKVGALREKGARGVPPIVDFGFTPDGSAFIVTSLVKARGFEEVLRASMTDRITVLLEVLGVLEGLAKIGSCHHNLSLDNIMIAGSIAMPQVTLVGLGTPSFFAGFRGKLAEGSPTDELRYLAPELLMGSRTADPGVMADMYSLALAAVEVLGGAATVEDAPAVVFDPASRIQLGDTEALIAFATKALAVDPALREGSFDGFRDVLIRVLPEEFSEGAKTMPLESILEIEKTLRVPVPKELGARRDEQPSSGDRAPASHGVSAIPKAVHEIPKATPVVPKTKPTAPKGPLEASEPERRIPKAEISMPGVGTKTASGQPSAPARAASKAPKPSADEALVSRESADVGDELNSSSDVEELSEEAVVEEAPVIVEDRASRPAPSLKPWALWTMMGLAAVALLVIAVVLGLYVVRSVFKPEPEPVVVVQSTPVPRPTATPVVEEARPINSQLELANGYIASGDTAAAREAISTLSDDEIASFNEEELQIFDEVQAMLASDDRQQVIADLRTGLRVGSVKMLERAAPQVRAMGDAVIDGEEGLRDQLRHAERALQAHAELWEAEKAGNRLEILRRAAAMQKALPKYGGAQILRDKTAAAIEADAEALIKVGKHEEALRQYEALKGAWPGRPGLNEKTATCRQLQHTESKLEDVLRSAIARGSAGNPEEGLRILASVTPTGTYIARFEAAKQDLGSRLARMDAKAPVVQLRQTAGLEFRKNESLTLPIEVTDDYRVIKARIHIRRESSPDYQRFDLEDAGGGSYPFTVTPQLHQNEGVLFYVEAIDRSGHVGSLGSANRPIEVSRKKWFQR